jgi:hypothetical protein
MSDVMAIRVARPEEAERLVPAYEWLVAPPGARPAEWDPEAAASRLRAAASAERSRVFVADEAGDRRFCTVYLDIVSVRFGQRRVEDGRPRAPVLGIGKWLLDARRTGRETTARRISS